MGLIEHTVRACLEESRDSKTPGVFICGYCRELAKQPGWTEEELEEVQRSALALALVRFHQESKSGGADHCNRISQSICV